MIPLCVDQGVGVHPVEPAGARAARRQRAARRRRHDHARSGNDPFADHLYSDDDFDVVDALAKVAAARPCRRRRWRWPGCSPARVTAPIVGATKLEHIEDAVAAVDLTLDRRRGKAAGGAVPPARGLA